MEIVGSAKELFKELWSGQTIFVHGGSATPNVILDGLIEASTGMTDIRLCHLHTHGPARYCEEEYRDRFKVINLFVGGNVRKKLNYDTVDYVPCFLSEIPNLFRRKAIPVDIAILQVSPPDEHGYVTLGTSVDVALAAVQNAKYVYAQINPQMPKVHGDGFIHISQIDRAIEVNVPIYEAEPKPLSDIDLKIGQHVAEIIDDGATLQTGIGSVPDAVLASLTNHKNLGVHTEMWSDGLLPLLENGTVNNSLKKTHPGKTVSGFCMGSRKLYDYINDNPSVVQMDVAYINNVTVIKRNPRVTAINSCVEIDLSGQVCADSVGHRMISGVGGQMDFIRGAALSEGGKPIIALHSRTAKGQSKIVPSLANGAGVVTTRNHIHWVATEHGIVNLYGKTLKERANLLISIAHPEDREDLSRQWVDCHSC